MSRKIFQVCLLFAAMIAIAFGVSWFFSKPTTTPVPKQLPNPNGYTLLVNVGSTLPMPTKDPRRMTLPELHALVDSNSNVLQLARSALTMDCQVPLRFSDAYRSNHFRVDLTALRRIAQLMTAEGRLAELESRTNDSVGCYLDIARLGARSARGGNAIDAVIGTAMESTGRDALRLLLDELDAKSCRDIAATLEELEAGRESWQQVLDNDPDWYRNAQTASLKYRLTHLVHGGPAAQSLKDTERSFHEQSMRTRRVIIDFAARAYELEHQQKPTSFTDLVPAYLKAIPTDPLTGTNMAFTP